MTESKSALYREAILEHSRRPRNQGRLERPDARAAAHNPLCGDELEMTLALAEGNIRELRFVARGCSIVMASASLMSEAVAGLATERAQALGDAFRELLDGSRDDLPEELASLAPLKVVRERPSRIRCALLPWEALGGCLSGGRCGGLGC